MNLTLTPRFNPNWSLILAFIIAFLFLIILNSCTCDYHLRKAKSKCGYTLKTDTIYKSDTTFVAKVTKDTVFNYYSRDTVVVREGRLTMKYFYNSHDSTVYLKGQCDTIRIIKEIPVQINTTEIKQGSFYKWAFFVLACVVLLLLLYKWAFKKD